MNTTIQVMVQSNLFITILNLLASDQLRKDLTIFPSNRFILNQLSINMNCTKDYIAYNNHSFYHLTVYFGNSSYHCHKSNTFLVSGQFPLHFVAYLKITDCPVLRQIDRNSGYNTAMTMITNTRTIKVIALSICSSNQTGNVIAHLTIVNKSSIISQILKCYVFSILLRKQELTSQIPEYTFVL